MMSSEQQGREIDLTELVQKLRDGSSYIWRSRLVVVRAMVISVTIGLIVALTSRVEYSATMRLLPYRSGAAGGGLSGLAGLAGIRLPAGVGDQTITADLYPIIARTLDFRVSVAETPLRFAGSQAPVTLIRYFEENKSTYDRIAATIADLRQNVSDALTGAEQRDTSTVLGSNGLPLRTFGREYLKIVGGLDQRLVVGIDKKTSVITITGLMPDAFAAADLVQTASERMMRRVIEYEAKKAAEQLTFVEQQYKQSKVRYETSQRALAVYADRNRMLVGAVAQVERERLQREYDVAFQVFQQFSLELEQARIKKNQDTPVFTVLEQVSVPNERTSPRRGAIVVLALMLGILWGVSEVIIRRMLAAEPVRFPAEGTTSA